MRAGRISDPKDLPSHTDSLLEAIAPGALRRTVALSGRKV